jgi:prevent-host-death family protein
MIEVSVHEAKTQLSRLLDLVSDGEEVLIHRHGRPVARLSPVRVPAESPFGAMRGQFRMKEGWERPLSDEEVDAFWEGKW